MNPKYMDKVIEINEVSIAYNEAGDGPLPIIFIHGFPFDRSSWDPQIKNLEEFYKVISLDLRGFGLSGMGNQEFSIDLFADDVIQLMDALTIPKAVICGLSMGGYIALNLTKRYKNRITGLILSDTQCIADSPEAKEKRYATVQAIQEGGQVEFARNFVKNIFSTHAIETNNQYIEHISKIILSTRPEAITGALKALAARTETCTMLKDIHIPVLIICGSDDKLTPVDKSVFMNQHIPNSRLEIINGAGHVANLERPELFNKLIHEFITEELS